MLGSFGSQIDRRLLGDRVEPNLRPLLFSIATNLAGLSVLTTYFGPWLLRDLHASTGLIAAGFLVAGVVGAVAALLGGWLSDRYGRGLIILGGGAVQIAATAALLLPVSPAQACAIFVVVRGVQSFRGVGQRALLADLSTPDAIEKAFAGFRLALHLGLFSGPVLGALLVTHSWRLMLGGACLLYLVSFFSALRVTGPRPARPRPAGSSEPAVTSPGMPRAQLLDGWLLLLLGASTTGWMVVYSYETVLPIVLVESGRITPQTWGYIFALGPLLVVLGQLRLGRWTRRLSVQGRMLIGSALMGAAFLPLLTSTSAAVLVSITVIFIVGDMLWGPASDSITVKIAPEGRRGGYLGMTMTGMWLGGALAPVFGLQIQAAYGDTALWLVVTGLAAASAALYAVVHRH